MILNEENNNYYKLLLDLNDLKALNINMNSFFGNSSNINIYITNILKKLNINNFEKITDIEIISFDFKVFHIKFSIS